MSEKINDGGPAFPITYKKYEERYPSGRWIVQTETGMSLRDYFAIRLAQTLKEIYQTGDFDHISQESYKFADAMLEAGKK